LDFQISVTAPIKVPLPKLHESDEIPSFIASASWMEGLRSKVLSNANLEDSEYPRVTPVAVTRCSRGGKTRSLHELAQAVRAADKTYALIFVSFNSATPVEVWENDDPLGALCRRIAFTALKRDEQVPSRSDMFNRFNTHYDVSPQSILDWLGTTKCILFVDELNKILMNAPVATFLKNNFLLHSGRGLVFSSHVVSLNALLCDFMDGQGSGREIRTYSLPNIVSLSDTRKQLKAGALSPQEVLFLGMSPSLIHTSLKTTLPFTRRDSVVSAWLVSGVGLEATKTLLSTILNGEIAGVPGTLLELMDIGTDSEKGTNYVRWIPFHMQYVLDRMTMYNDLPLEFRACTKGLSGLITTFRTAKSESGDAWEALFIMVLLIRCLCGEFNDSLLPLAGFGSSARVRYNEPYHGNNFFSTSVSEFLDGVPVSGGQLLPAISVYYPRHASFEVYDVIVATWDIVGNRTLYGYQCKEGSKTPSTFANQTMFNSSYLVRGAPAQNDQSIRLWITPDEEYLDIFFGKTATQWSPKARKQLNSPTHSLGSLEK
jgi:hypothetical protein